MSISSFKLVVVALVFIFLCLFLRELSKTTNAIPNLPDLTFVPKRQGYTCDDLFVNTSAAKFSFTKNYMSSIVEFNKHLHSVTGGSFSGDGHVGMFPAQQLSLHYLASLPFVKGICETGFNYGHSSLTYLTANEKAIVHSFDIAFHSYTKPMAAYLSKTFPGRFFAHFGDSSVTVPAFIRENPNFRCDFTFVDGSHSYSVAKSDLDNFRSITNFKNNVVAMDDYPTLLKLHAEYGKAWDGHVGNKTLFELMRCTRKTDQIRGFTIGSFVQN